MKFPLGKVVSTPGALDLAEELEDPGLMKRLLLRHVAGDWGDLSEEDLEANQLALQNGTRLFSSYNVNEHCKIWIITEADRSATTFLLPSEY